MKKGEGAFKKYIIFSIHKIKNRVRLGGKLSKTCVKADNDRNKDSNNFGHLLQISFLQQQKKATATPWFILRKDQLCGTELVVLMSYDAV
jgi:hypothetical protein